MSEQKQDFRALMQRIHEGSEDAVREMIDRYGPHILRVVRRKLDPKLRSKYDSADFVQSVWASFFAYRYERVFERPEALIAFLVSLARNKVVDAVRQRLQRQKYNVNRERSLQGSALPAANEVRALQPTASQIAVAKEEWERLVDDLATTEKKILDLSMAGRSADEIATELGLTYRHVRRVMHNLATRMVAP